MKKIALKFFVLLALFSVGNVNAGVIRIGTQAEFNALGSTHQNTNFESYSAGWSFPSNPLTVGDLTFRAGGQALVGGNEFGFARQNFTDNYVRGVNIDVANRYNMFAVSAGNYYSAGRQIFNLMTNLGSYTFKVDVPLLSYAFFGFLATNGEHIISFNDGGDTNHLATGFTDVKLANTSPVPVPAAVWLFGSGLMGMFGLKKRKIA